MSVNVGLVISSSAATPRPLMMPFASVVFPAPNSPASKTSSGARKCAASSLPLAIVSSEECETTSPLRISQRLYRVAKLRTCGGNRTNQVARDQRRFAKFLGGQISRQPVEINAARERQRPALRARLRRQTREHSCEHISRAARGHSGIPGGINPRCAVRRGKNRLIAF